MVWLTGLLTTLLVLSADWAGPEPVDRAGMHVMVGLICLLLAPAFAVVQSWVTSRRWKGRQMAQHRSDFLHRSLMASNLIVWLFGCVAFLVIARWPQLIRGNWSLNSIPLLDELALAVPMLGSVLLSWFVIHDAEQALNREVNQRAGPRSVLALQRFRTFAGLVLVPIAMLFLMRDLTELVFPEGIGTQATLLSFVAFLFVLLAVYPVVLSRTWQTSCIDDSPLGKKLRLACREAGMPGQQFRKWHTNSTVTNALVVGILPRLRRIFLSDHLLEKFDDDEVVAVCRHELGHIAYSHLHMRIALVLVPLLCLVAITWSATHVYAANLGLDGDGKVLVCLLAAVTYFVYAAKVVTRFGLRSEVQADLYAICRKDGTVCLRQANAYCQALLKMAAISPELFDRSTLAHPAIRLRIQLIRQVLEEPSRIERFHRRFQLEQQIAAACLVVLVLVAVWLGQIS